MAAFNFILDEDVVAAIDEHIKELVPKPARRHYIEQVLYTIHKERVDQLKAERRQREAKAKGKKQKAQIANVSG